jgi:hypothetical protein
MKLPGDAAASVWQAATGLLSRHCCVGRKRPHSEPEMNAVAQMTSVSSATAAATRVLQGMSTPSS